MGNSEDELARLQRENAELRTRLHALEHAVPRGAEASFLESVLRAVPAFIARLDPELRVRYVNRYQPGTEPQMVLGRPIFDFQPPDMHERLRDAIEAARATGRVVQLPSKVIGAHGDPYEYIAYVAPLRNDDGTIGFCLAAVDVTESMARERTLRETEEKLRAARDATGLGLWSWDLGTGEVVWDERMHALHGVDTPVDLAGYAALIHPDERESFIRETSGPLVAGAFASGPHRVQRPDGSVRWLLTIGRVVPDEGGAVSKVVGGTLDVSAQRQLEEQLRQAQKMEVIGTLTAGIAHNFNNMLTVILPTLELATRVVPAERIGLLREAQQAARRAEMVQQLMTYAGHSPSHDRSTVSARELIEASLAICQRAIDPTIEVGVHLEGAPAAITCNVVQVEQVLVNLLLNARDAVLEARREHGRIDVVVETASRALASLEPSVPARDAVCIRVIDNGAGMRDEVRDKVFEPFFTTKGPGRGTGLGLATSYAIARDHDGTLACEPANDGGTRFTLMLPLASDAAAQRAP